MDRFKGKPGKPLTLNKYIYADADGVNRIDPSGYMSLGEVSIGISLGSALGLTAQTAVGGLYNSYAGPNGRPTHYYEAKQIQICTSSPRCTPKKVYEAMLRMPAPAHIDPDVGAPVYDGEGGYAGWLVFPGGPVIFNRIDGSLTLINQTSKWHILHNGKITRTAQVGMGGVTIKTIGQGDNHTAFIAMANERVGKLAFESLDRSIKAWFDAEGTP